MATISEFPNYRIYNNGDIWSTKKNKFLSKRLDKDGYQRCNVYNKEKKMKTLFIHQLVAMAYLDHELSDQFVVDHIDNNKFNNYLHNLQLILREQNCRKGCKTKGSKPRGTRLIGKKKYRAEIQLNKERYNLGTYENEHYAHIVYQIVFDTLMIGVQLD